ncbi:IMPACT family protein [Zophobihabitans entericus]|uniref:YigZ family protein n=1 Tax=Zophobihabitans entericus TaxID=1635327 RepID=A0A6G9IEN6_9GAMM|nr:YigZ family protein [Zophobihabitans entericus]QIQ22050.1 YigZ family protein [Zophobihabitans entericus]
MTFTLVEPYQWQEEIKKSRFLVRSAPVTTTEQAQQFIQANSDATANHNCWAWKIGQQYRFSDDGEPSGTAGRPILSAIEGQQIDEVVVLVIRWFGGIKLGAGGLIRAYGGCAAHCLQSAPLKPIILRQHYQFSCHYHEWPILENRLRDFDVIIDEQIFGTLGPAIKMAIPTEEAKLFQETLVNLTKGRESLTILDK